MVVTVSSFRYSPDPVEVDSGGSVTWTWRGEDRHSVSADDASFDSDPGCADNPLLRDNCRTAGAPDFTWTAPEVTERTTITYRCKLHGESEGMTGAVVVVPPAPSASPSPSPSDSPSPSPSPSRSPSGSGGGASPSPSPGGSSGPSGPRVGAPPALGSQTMTSPSSSEPSVSSPEVAAPRTEAELEEFPSPSPLPTVSESEDLGGVAVGLPDDDDGTTRRILLAVAALAVTGSAVAFASLVLFGPSWR